MRMDDDSREELIAFAERSEVSPSRLVNRYVREGLRMDKHPAISFKTTQHARYFHINEDDVQAVLRYYAEYKDEIDQDLQAHLDAQANYKRVLEQREARVRRRVAKA